MNWPHDVDGDVFRRLLERGFDFEKDAVIDFDIDFDHWPLSDNEKENVSRLYSNCEFYDPDEEDIEEGNSIGYVQWRLEARLTYEFVMETQKRITEQMQSLGGRCNSWGVLC